jgi:hypothetical protein
MNVKKIQINMCRLYVDMLHVHKVVLEKIYIFCVVFKKDKFLVLK